VLIPVVIFVVCLVGGVVVSTQWLPPLADGATGGLAFLVVCGLLGVTLALVGLHVYLIIESLDQFGGGFKGIEKGQVLATGLVSMIWEAGSVLGLAGVVYLLAPRPAEATTEPSPRTGM
jgi:hypothetical protein